MTSLSPYLLILSILTVRCLTVAPAKCHVDDETGLLGFKSGISQDPSGILQSWKPGSDCCTWAGINCLLNNRVTALSLYGQLTNPNSFLSGKISDSLSKLTYLDGIYFVNTRNLSGPFPDLLFRLPNLLYIYIENNQLSGQIPNKLSNLTRLFALSLSGNLFSGPIPSSLSQLTQLTYLNLAGNQLSGQIPTGIQRLKNLTVLGLHGNQLSGKIPDFFSSFTNLRLLKLSRNQLSGAIPATISTLAAKLTYLELGHNNLYGKLPNYLGNFRSLDTLDLSWNRFTGTVPKSLGNLTKIFNLDLSHNLLTDPFPEMNVKGIESLDLSYNKFNLTKIPKWVTSSPIIYSLKLAKCGLKLKLDDWKPMETYFYDYIDLSENDIWGTPIELLNRTDYLVGFSISGNRVQFDLEKLSIVKTLKELDLSRNSVFGKVPAAVSGLEKLNLSYNRLCGKIPAAAAKFPATSFVGNDCLCGSPLYPCKV